MAGPDEGPAVLFLHPAPGSRLFVPGPLLGTRVVTVDRPGYGRSAPPVGIPTVAGIADEVAATVRAVGIHDIGVIGWSAGGRIALALAARHPDLVRALAVVGTPAPDDAVPWVPDEHRPLLHALRATPDAAVEALCQAFAGFPADPAAVTGGPADDEELERHRPELTRMVEEGFRQGPVGTAVDIVADQVVPWGVDPAAVGAPTTLFYGAEDNVVPPVHGKHWADVVPEAKLRVVPGIGHLVVYRAWDEVVASVT